MNNEQSQPRRNPLVENARAAGAALSAGDREKLQAAAQALARGTSGGFRPASATDRYSPGHIPHARPNAGNADANHRAVYIDKPPPGHGR